MAVTQSVSSIWSHFVWGGDSQKPRSPRLCASLLSEQQVLSGKDSSVLDGIHGWGSPNSSSCRRESCRDFSLFHCVSLFLMWQNAKAISPGVSQLTLSEHLSCYWLLTKGSRIQGSWDWPLDTSLTVEGGRWSSWRRLHCWRHFMLLFQKHKCGHWLVWLAWFISTTSSCVNDFFFWNWELFQAHEHLHNVKCK